jgi:hypothetical protein
MKINLSEQEKECLKTENIIVSSEKEYSEDELLNILDDVHEIEQAYSNYPITCTREFKLAQIFAGIADNIQKQIPNF